MANLVVVGERGDLHDVVLALRDAGHEVVLAKTGSAGEAAALRGAELLVIDQRLADVRGSELCRRMRADDKLGEIPVIMLADVGDEIDRVVALEVGADDVMARPLSLRELVLRVRAVLRRRLRGPTVVPHNGEGFAVDVAGHRVVVDGGEVVLSALELRLLSVLYRQRGRVHTRQQLLDDVWGGRLYVSARTVDACVKRLRNKLGRSGYLVETVRGVGYRFANGRALIDDDVGVWRQ